MKSNQFVSWLIRVAFILQAIVAFVVPTTTLVFGVDIDKLSDARKKAHISPQVENAIWQANIVAKQASANVFTVTDQGDMPDDSLEDGILHPATFRAAIENANRFPDHDDIIFDPSVTVVYRTAPSASWPNIVYPVKLDGNIGDSGRVIIDGGHMAGVYGPVFLNGNCTIENVEFRNFDNWGILLQANSGNMNVIRNCVIHDNDGTGINFNNSTNNLIGGLSDSDRNYIFANQESGLSLIVGSGHNTVIGNYIGTNDGVTDSGNGSHGLEVETGGNQIVNNLISGNAFSGVYIAGPNADTNLIQSNIIGLDKNGASPLPNGSGIGIGQSSADTVRDNTVSGNNGVGIGITTQSWDIVIEENFVGTDPGGFEPIGNLYAGISLYGKRTVVQGNIIGGNSSGIDIGSDSSTVRDNIIGDFELSHTPLGNVYYGVSINFGKANKIGGPGSEDGNLISGNGRHGVNIKGFNCTDNVVEGNFIGTIASGMLGLGNDSSGVNITHGAKRNIIRDNLISGNLADGISFKPQFDSIPRQNSIYGNLIGLAADTVTGLANGRFGIWVDSGWNNFIGVPGEHPNVITDHDTCGIALIDAKDNVIQNNLIGVLPDSLTAKQNFGDGICLERAETNTIGGRQYGEGNLIARNQGAGIRLVSGTGNQFLGNILRQNGKLGIDLVGRDSLFGVTLNDTLDADTGANHLQNMPTLTFVGHQGGNTTVTGFQDGIPGTPYVLDFYEVNIPDPSGFGETDSLLDSLVVIPDTSGFAHFTHIISGTLPHVVATATNATQGTSELSKSPIMINTTSDGADVDPSDANCNSGGSPVNGVSACTFRAAIQLANKLLGPDYIGFDIPGSAPFSILPDAELPFITGETVIDGTTQPGYATDTPVIKLNGISAGPSAGLFVENDRSQVKAMTISGFNGFGIRCTGDDLKLDEIRVTGNAKSGIYCDGDLTILMPCLAEYNGSSWDKDAGILVGGKLSAEDVNVNHNVGAGVHANEVAIDGNVSASNNSADGMYSYSTISIIGQQHDFSDNGKEGIIAYQGRMKIEGSVTSNNNGSANTPTECMNVYHGGINAGGEIELDDVTSNGNCGSGIFTDSYVKLKGNAELKNNSQYGINALGYDVWLGGDFSDLSSNGSTGLNAGSATVHIAHKARFNQNGTREQMEDPQFCLPGDGSPDHEYGAGGFFASKLEAKDIEASDNCGIGVTSGELEITGEALIRANSAHGVAARVVKIASGRIVSNQGYGVIVRPANQYAPGGIVQLGAVSVSNNALGGVYVLPNPPNPRAATIRWANSSQSNIMRANITGNSGDGVNWQSLDTLNIVESNISGNSGFGINLQSGSNNVVAPNNWWGNASGPGGAGPGSGDEISAGVNVASWLNSAKEIALSFLPDTLYAEAGTTDTIRISAYSWTIPHDILNFNISDSAGWVISSLTPSVPISDTIASQVEVVIAIPGGTAVGTQAQLLFAAQAQSNLTAVDSTVVTILTYTPQLTAIVIAPDSATVPPGGSLQFQIIALDQFERSFEMVPKWTATGGTVDATGLYLAGTTLGDFLVTVSDSTESVTAQAVVSINIISDVSNNDPPVLPREFALYQNFPNPFNPATTISYDLPFRSSVTVEIFNVLGQRVRTLVNEVKPAGRFSVMWNSDDQSGKTVSSGAYFYRLKAEGIETTKKMLLMK